MSNLNHSRTDNAGYHDYTNSLPGGGSFGTFTARCFNCEKILREYEGRYCDDCVKEQEERAGTR